MVPRTLMTSYVVFILLFTGVLYIGKSTHIRDLERPGEASLSGSRTVRWSLPDNNGSSWTAGRSLPAELQDCEQEDPHLISYIHDHWILHPVNDKLQLDRPTITHFSQHSQSAFLDSFFQNKTRGFYIECGAYNGERLSNSLYFERERNWDGLLIEADPGLFHSLQTKHRHAYMVNTCLSSSRRASMMNFTSSGPFGGITQHQQVNLSNTKRAFEFHQVQCLPLYSILAGLGLPHVDFFSLDIEGAEIPVLLTLDLDKVEIDLFLIEVGRKGKNSDKINTIVAMLESKGYRVVDIPPDPIDIVMTKL